MQRTPPCPGHPPSAPQQRAWWPAKLVSLTGQEVPDELWAKSAREPAASPGEAPGSAQPPGCSTVALTEQRLRPHRKGSGGLIFIEARQSQRLWLGWVLSASCDPPAVCARKAGMLGSRERLPPAGRRAVHPCVGGQ